jgi:hypothetical protein
LARQILAEKWLMVLAILCSGLGIRVIYETS